MASKEKIEEMLQIAQGACAYENFERLYIVLNFLLKEIKTK